MPRRWTPKPWISWRWSIADRSWSDRQVRWQRAKLGRNRFFSPTAESFGVSAQIGSGVVRGGPEVRFLKSSARVPPGFHQVFTRVPPGFHQGSTRVPPGFHQGSTRVPPGFHQGSTRVPPGFHQGSTRVPPVSQGLRGGPGWFEVRFYEGWFCEVRFHEGFTRVSPGFHQSSTRVPPGFARAAGVVRVP